MPRYFIQASHTAEAAAALASKPHDRTEGLRAVMDKLGAQLVSFDYSLGEYDIYAIYTAPDDTTAAAIALAIKTPGHVRAYKATKLLYAIMSYRGMMNSPCPALGGNQVRTTARRVPT